jgi:esterase/lipase superfamily enzyme
MPKYWMISNRAIKDGAPSGELGDLGFWVADDGPLDQFASWQSKSAGEFQSLLVQAASAFPLLPQAQNEDQSHVTFFIHGYNNGWQDAARRYQKLCDGLFSGDDGMGLCISFDWPSMGSVVDYLPDREHARACAFDLADVLSELFDWLVGKQAIAVTNPALACRAKVSVISHSMGNYLLQKAMAAAWTRKNQPLLVSLINQLIMVAADVDNDLFDATAPDGNDGNAVANLTYRITSLYSGRDAVLGASAGLKHFGTRRLGRSGLAIEPVPGKDNVWEIDCSSFFPAADSGLDIHSAYFETPATVSLIGDILTGLDRGVLETLGKTTSDVWP